MPDAGGLGGRADVGERRAGPRIALASKSFSFGLRFFGGPCTHLNEQESYAGRELIELSQCEALAAHELDEHVVEAFEADGTVFESQWNCVGGNESVGESQHGEDAKRRAGGKVELGRKNCCAGAFRADQGAGYVEAGLGKQLIEVVAGNAARDARETFRG